MENGLTLWNSKDDLFTFLSEFANVYVVRVVISHDWPENHLKVKEKCLGVIWVCLEYKANLSVEAVCRLWSQLV